MRSEEIRVGILGRADVAIVCKRDDFICMVQKAGESLGKECPLLASGGETFPAV